MRKRKGVTASLLLGNKFSRLTCVAIVDRPIMVIHVECKCDCGNTIYVKPNELIRSVVRSCGCLKKDTQRARLKLLNTRHGEAKRGNSSPEYRTWLSIRARCNDKNNGVFEHYGGRGIKVCDRWLNSFPAFLEDIGRKPSSKHSIERINHNGDYEPLNCKWATDHEQMRNRRSNKFFTINGETLCMTDWAKKYNKNYQAVHARLKRGWTIEQALELK